MIRRLLLPLLVAIGVGLAAVGTSPSPAAATPWLLFNHPGGSWAYIYVEDDANPQYCAGIGSGGDARIGWSYAYVIFENDANQQLQVIKDRYADGSNVCGRIPTGATRARIGLFADGGPTGLHNGWSYVFDDDDWTTAYPWACVGCWS